jgi:hypothetical protein
MESWQFIQSPAGEWYWLCSNVISRQTRTSAATFKTRMECVANAMGSGYQKVAVGVAATPQPKAAPGRGSSRHPKAPAGGGQAPAKRAQRRGRDKSGKRSKAN